MGHPLYVKIKYLSINLNCHLIILILFFIITNWSARRCRGIKVTTEKTILKLFSLYVTSKGYPWLSGTEHEKNKQSYLHILNMQVAHVIRGFMGRGEEGQPQQFLVRASFSSFSRPSHLGILVLRLFCVNCVKKFSILEDKTIF